ncbi:hypothetical protein Poli38472_004025 [Pythium oligandrum]|uniref:AAA+ ATPase domain-containing protein n=1 Tax=Pythium oligandrum TaxID=41045 RepID=A0A8K1CPA8_PYTOL|nr:hypothetical protein Poli38472_004025 [Pythium oligandrum]|eukprot:TMW66260.1 hypothetical protein Poli38472_004025 [Pythium oligandrum]
MVVMVFGPSRSMSSACPICSRHFRQENLALHVEACLTRSASVEKKRKREEAQPEAIPSRIPTPPRSGAFLSPPPSKSPVNDAVERPVAMKKRTPRKNDNAPLAERMRPNNLDEFVGQDELVGPGKLLSTLIQTDRVPNMILWGPPGCGKTTLATIISRRTGCKFICLSGATSNMADMKEAIDKARGEKKMFRRHTIVFVDEIHRFKKNQQDFFLPPVEDGTITLIGATTENPSFEINNALLSRCRVYTLAKHTLESIRRILDRAVTSYSADPSQLRGVNLQDVKKIEADEAALEYLANQCGGDARVALNCLEMALQTTETLNEDNTLRITEDHVKHCFANRQTLFYDRNADFHYDLISAFHKSVRGSDANGALYWLGRMLEGGENPLYIARRMIRIAAEDIGLAAPHLLEQAVAAYHAAHFTGMPECDVVLAQCATLLARAPKSVEVYKAYKRVKASIRGWNQGAQPDVPMHLRNAPTRLMQDLGYSAGYKYNPDYTEEETKDQTYLPQELLSTNFFEDDTTQSEDNNE